MRSASWGDGTRWKTSVLLKHEVNKKCKARKPRSQSPHSITGDLEPSHFGSQWIACIPHHMTQSRRNPFFPWHLCQMLNPLSNPGFSSAVAALTELLVTIRAPSGEQQRGCPWAQKRAPASPELSWYYYSLGTFLLLLVFQLFQNICNYFPFQNAVFETSSITPVCLTGTLTDTVLWMMYLLNDGELLLHRTLCLSQHGAVLSM